MADAAAILRAAASGAHYLRHIGAVPWWWDRDDTVQAVAVELVARGGDPMMHRRRAAIDAVRRVAGRTGRQRNGVEFAVDAVPAIPIEHRPELLVDAAAACVHLCPKTRRIGIEALVRGRTIADVRGDEGISQDCYHAHCSTFRRAIREAA